MYKSIHEIPTYNYYKCEKGDLTYLGRGFFRKRRFAKLQSQFGEGMKPDPVIIDQATKMNWLSVMQVLAKAQLQMVFATPEQKAEMLKLLKFLGLSFNHEENCKRIQSFIDLIKRDQVKEPEKKEQTIDNLYSNAIFIQMVLGKDVDIRKTSIAEFTTLIKLAQKKADRNGK